MAHVIEPASSGRAKCRGCGEKIEKGELRFGEQLPNPYAEGEMTLWFHVPCAAYKRPAPLLEAMETTTETLERREWLASETRRGVAHRRLPRVNGAERAATGRARCRCCRELIEKGGWRVSLVYFDGGRFEPSGFIHASCSLEYFETDDVLERVSHFSPGLTENDLAELQASVKPTDE
jgi:hypothetical protein